MALQAPGRSGESSAADGAETILARIKADIAAGTRSVQDALVNPDWMPLHEDPRFRRIIRLNASGAKLVMVPGDEPGTPLVVSGTVRADDGRPIEGAMLYVFHTGAGGSYSSSGGNVADMGDSLNPRLFGYLKTGADGRYEFRTIRPGQYPDNGPPAHVHYQIDAPGFARQTTELMFEDDSRMTPETQRWAVESGFVVTAPVKGDDGVFRCTADWVLRRS
jgi:protocatechuate 3,4-dioxygenase beta subunit